MHAAKNVEGADVVVYTAAVFGKGLDEVNAARDLGALVITRGEFLGYLMKKYDLPIGVSGTHGKTSTTGMISHIMLEAELDPTIANGAVGVVRRDPMAMRPFVGYNMGDYFKHWLDMGKVIPNAPKIFHVNWFRTDDNGNFIWPGFGDNMRVLLWILARCEGKVDAVETAIGYVPKAEDINIEGLSDVTVDTIRELLSIDNASWKEDVANIKEFYAQIGDHVPAEMYEELAALEARLG